MADEPTLDELLIRIATMQLDASLTNSKRIQRKMMQTPGKMGPEMTQHLVAMLIIAVFQLEADARNLPPLDFMSPN